jgi:hypothetical protein
MESTINLTSAEIELIRLKRIEDESKQQQEALKQQLQYDKDLRYQNESLNKTLETIEKINTCNASAYDELVLLNCHKFIELKSRKRVHEFSSYKRDEIKPEDWRKEEVDQYYIDTKWGSLEFDCSMKSNLPSSLSTRYQSYTIKSIASKMIEKVKQEVDELKDKNNKLLYQESLIEQLTDESPEGTTFVKSIEWKSNTYSKERGHYVDIIIITYPNKSWIKINVGIGMWWMMEKFDSKYIKPETREEWLTYLMS